MFSYNRVQIIGYQTQNIDLRQTPSGTSVTDLNLVVPYNFTAENGDLLSGKGFHTVTIWGSMADVVSQYIKPGSQIFINGRLQTDSWEDEQTGEKRNKTKIVALDMILLDPKDGQLPPLQGAPELEGSLNRADIIGHISRDPELRTTTSGQQVLSLGVATNDRWRDKASGEDRERSEFHNIVIWGKLADQVSKHLKKGNRVYVSGRVQTRNWETQDGNKRYTTEIIADKVSLLGAENTAVKDNIEYSGQNSSANKVKSSDNTARRVVSAPQNADTQVSDDYIPEAAVSVPKVAYSSEIKVEDLPF